MAYSFQFPSKAEQDAHWQRKDDEYQAYLNDLHQRQQDPQYVESYKRWLDETEGLNL